MAQKVILNGHVITMPKVTIEVIDGKKRKVIDGRVVPETPKHIFCEACGEELEPIFKATRKREDWIHLQCDVCGEHICESCSEEDEEEGTVICIDCIAEKARKENK